MTIKDLIHRCESWVTPYKPYPMAQEKQFAKEDTKLVLELWTSERKRVRVELDNGRLMASVRGETLYMILDIREELADSVKKREKG